MKTFLPVVLVTVLIGGCASSAVQLKPAFWTRKGARVAVAMATLPDARAHRAGDEGALLAMAINKGMNDTLNSRMKVIGPKLLSTATDSFVAKLRAQGFDARKVSEDLALDAFKKFQGTGEAKYFGRDLRSLAQKHDADLLLLLNVERYGTLRQYSPLLAFVPTGPPRALFQVRGQVIDLATNELLWQRYLTDDEATLAVEGEWNEAPDFPNLVKALENVVPASMTRLEREFFATATP